MENCFKNGNLDKHTGATLSPGACSLHRDRRQKLQVARKYRQDGRVTENRGGGDGRALKTALMLPYRCLFLKNFISRQSLNSSLRKPRFTSIWESTQIYFVTVPKEKYHSHTATVQKEKKCLLLTTFQVNR